MKNHKIKELKFQIQDMTTFQYINNIVISKKA